MACGRKQKTLGLPRMLQRGPSWPGLQCGLLEGRGTLCCSYVPISPLGWTFGDQHPWGFHDSWLPSAHFHYQWAQSVPWEHRQMKKNEQAIFCTCVPIAWELRCVSCTGIYTTARLPPRSSTPAHHWPGSPAATPWSCRGEFGSPPKTRATGPFAFVITSDKRAGTTLEQSSLPASFSA